MPLRRADAARDGADAAADVAGELADAARVLVERVRAAADEVVDALARGARLGAGRVRDGDAGIHRGLAEVGDGETLAEAGDGRADGERALARRDARVAGDEVRRGVDAVIAAAPTLPYPGTKPTAPAAPPTTVSSAAAQKPMSPPNA